MMKSREAVISPAIFVPAIDPVLSKTKAISSGDELASGLAASAFTEICFLPTNDIKAVGLLMRVATTISSSGESFRVKLSRLSFCFKLKFSSKTTLAMALRSFFLDSPDAAAASTAMSVACCKSDLRLIRLDASTAAPMPIKRHDALTAKMIEKFPLSSRNNDFVFDLSSIILLPCLTALRRTAK